MVRAHARALAWSVIPGKRCRSSMMADSSPVSWKALRIAAALASVTMNMAGAWTTRTTAGEHEHRRGLRCLTRPRNSWRARRGSGPKRAVQAGSEVPRFLQARKKQKRRTKLEDLVNSVAFHTWAMRQPPAGCQAVTLRLLAGATAGFLLAGVRRLELAAGSGGTCASWDAFACLEDRAVPGTIRIREIIAVDEAGW